MSEPKCESCGTPWTEHLGIMGTCQRLRDALAREANYREQIEALLMQRDEALEQRDELAEAIDELGTALFGPADADGKTWRDARAEWWQRCVRAVEAAEGTGARNDGDSGRNETSVLWTIQANTWRGWMAIDEGHDESTMRELYVSARDRGGRWRLVKSTVEIVDTHETSGGQ